MAIKNQPKDWRRTPAPAAPAAPANHRPEVVTYQIPQTQKVIDGVRWGLSPLPARQVFDVFEDLASLFGPTMASLAQAARVASASVAGPPVRTQEVADGEQQAEAPAADLTDIDISAAITTLSMRLVADRALYGIVRRLLHDLTDDNRHLVGQRDEVFDYYFRGGQTARLLPIVGWALTMNYADFFGWLGGNVNAQNIAEKLTSLLHKG